MYKLESLSDEGEGLLGLGLTEVQGIALLSGSASTILLLSLFAIIIACCPCCATVRSCLAKCCQLTLIPGCRLLCSSRRPAPRGGVTNSSSPSLATDGDGPQASSATANTGHQHTPSSGGATCGSSTQVSPITLDTTGYGGSVLDDSTDSDRPVPKLAGVQPLAHRTASLARDAAARSQSLIHQDRPELRNSIPALHAGAGHPISHYLGQDLHKTPLPGTHNPLGQHAAEMMRLSQPPHNPSLTRHDTTRPTAPPVVVQPQSGRFDNTPLQQLVEELVVTEYSPKLDFVDIQIRCPHSPTLNYLRVDVGTGRHENVGIWCKLCENKFRDNGFGDFVFDPVFLTRLTGPDTAIRHYGQLSQRLLDLVNQGVRAGMNLNSPSKKSLLNWIPCHAMPECQFNGGCSNCKP